MFEGAWNDAFMSFTVSLSLHSVGLSRAGLPVGEDGAVISLENTFNNGESSLLENPFLLAARFEGQIEAEHSFLLA